jgi:hypothetical protein
MKYSRRTTRRTRRTARVTRLQYAARAPYRQGVAHRPPAPLVIATLCEVVRNTYPELARAKWCIQATRVVSLIGEQFGLHVEPIEVATLAANAAEVHAIGLPNPMPTYPGQIRGVVQSGFGSPDRPHSPPNFDGHMVALVNGEYLVDLALGQFGRPHGIAVPSTWAMRTHTLTGEDGDAEVAVFDDAGPSTMVVYKRRRLSIDPTSTGAWNSTMNRELARKIAKKLTKRLASPYARRPARLEQLRVKPALNLPDWQQSVSRRLMRDACTWAEEQEPLVG